MALNLVPEIEEEGRKWRFMGIYGKNREEWVLTDIADFKNSIVTIAFYDTLGPQAVEFVIRQTNLTTISCSGNYLPSLIKLKREGKANTVENLVSFDKFEAQLKDDGKSAGLNIYHINEVMEAGKNYGDMTFNEPKHDSIKMFCYTSGTTGDPKAAMLTHRNLLASSAAAKAEGLVFTEFDRHISYLPLAHSFE